MSEYVKQMHGIFFFVIFSLSNFYCRGFQVHLFTFHFISCLRVEQECQSCYDENCTVA